MSCDRLHPLSTGVPLPYKARHSPLLPPSSTSTLPKKTMNFLLVAAAALVSAVMAQCEPAVLNVAVPPGGFVAPTDPNLLRCRSRSQSQHIMPDVARVNGFQPNPYASSFEDCHHHHHHHHHQGCGCDGL